MVQVATPIIKPENYESFRRLPESDLPATYNEFAHWVSTLTAYATNLEPVPIEVTAAEFAQYCQHKEWCCTLQSLKAFAFEKAKELKRI
jgi:hypothetical protein